MAYEPLSLTSVLYRRSIEPVGGLYRLTVSLETKFQRVTLSLHINITFDPFGGLLKDRDVSEIIRNVQVSSSFP